MTSIDLEEFRKISKQQAQEFSDISRQQAMETAELYAKKRAEERSEDIQKFSELIENCVQSKIDTALKPVIEKQNVLEEKTSRAINELTDKLEAVQKLVTKSAPDNDMSSHSTAPPPTAPAARPWHLPPASMPPAEITSPPTDVLSKEAIIKNRFEAGRLTLGFEPIDQDDLNRIARINDIQDSEFVMRLAVAEFLRYDMNVKTVDSSNIVKVFVQPNTVNQKGIRLYAQFDNISSINMIWQNVNRLHAMPDHHVMIYVPSTHQDQYSYLNNIGYPYRKPQQGQVKCSTRVKYGTNDLYLQYRPLGCPYWTTVNAPNLPPANLRNNIPSLSPPPIGRQRNCQQTQKRAASTSPQNKTPKMSRTEEPSEPISESINQADGLQADGDGSEKAEGDGSETNEVFEPFNGTFPAIPDQFKGIYARRLSLNSNLLT